MFAADIALSGLICSFETVILYFPLWFAISTSFTAEGLIGYHWVINHFQLIFHFHGWDDMHHDSLVFSGSLLCRFATSLVRRNGWDLVTSVRLTTCGRTWPPVVLLQGMLSFRGYWYTYDIIWSYFFSNSPKVALACVGFYMFSKVVNTFGVMRPRDGNRCLFREGQHFRMAWRGRYVISRNVETIHLGKLD